MWYNIILRSIEYKVWVFLHILWSLPSILQARIKLQFWGELFKLNNNFQNNAKFNVGPWRFLIQDRIWAKEFWKFLHHIWMFCTALIWSDQSILSGFCFCMSLSDRWNSPTSTKCHYSLRYVAKPRWNADNLQIWLWSTFTKMLTKEIFPI